VRERERECVSVRDEGGKMRREEKDGKRRRVNPYPKLSESDIRKVREPSKN
jgi:hypothetical protein